MTAALPQVPHELELVKDVYQNPFQLPTERWRSALGRFPGVAEVLDELPAAVGRQDVAEALTKAWPANVAGAFVATMMWGYGDAGYGPSRVARILTQTPANLETNTPDSDVIAKLRQSIELAAKDGAVAAYRYLNNDSLGHIKHFGPAFFTKWLHFGTRRSGVDSGTAPILDRLVIAFLNQHAVKIRPGVTDDYARYIKLLAAWGKQPEHPLHPADVEERIFVLIRDQQRKRSS